MFAFKVNLSAYFEQYGTILMIHFAEENPCYLK